MKDPFIKLTAVLVQYNDGKKKQTSRHVHCPACGGSRFGTLHRSRNGIDFICISCRRNLSVGLTVMETIGLN